MQLALTKKLMDLTEITPSSAGTSADIDPFYRWSTNVVPINRRKAVIAVCDSNHFGVVLYGLKAKDFKNLPTLLAAEIERVLLQYGIQPALVQKYLFESGETIPVKLSDKKSISRMNKAIQYLERFGDVFDTTQLSQTLATQIINRNFVKRGESNFKFSCFFLFQDFERSYQEPLFCSRGIDLTISLDLEHHIAWRRMIIPDAFTFEQLHALIQTAFCWQNYHRYRFEMGSIRVVDSEEAFEYEYEDAALFLAPEKKFSDFSTLPSELVYLYDFGDYWEHVITINGFVEGYQKCTAEFVDGAGDAPPEDVGGVGGYVTFLKALSDSNHPEHEDVVEWITPQWKYKPFDAERTKRCLLTYIIGGGVHGIY